MWSPTRCHHAHNRDGRPTGHEIRHERFFTFLAVGSLESTKRSPLKFATLFCREYSGSVCIACTDTAINLFRAPSSAGCPKTNLARPKFCLASPDKWRHPLVFAMKTRHKRLVSLRKRASFTQFRNRPQIVHFLLRKVCKITQPMPLSGKSCAHQAKLYFLQKYCNRNVPQRDTVRFHPRFTDCSAVCGFTGAVSLGSGTAKIFEYLLRNHVNRE